LSWTPEARAICERAVARHGGWPAWNSLESVSLRLQSISGLLPAWKGYGDTFTLPAECEFFPHQRKAVFPSYPTPESRAIYDQGSARFGPAGVPDGELLDARTWYRGWRKLHPWTTLDAVYFFGYAWTTYLSLPFIFPRCRLIRTYAHREQGELWNALVVEFPREIETHCPRQTFYFDSDGWLRRNDYHAEIIGRWAMAAHYFEDYRPVDGIQISVHRRVYARVWRFALPVLALAADLEPV
jgi:hypothetical protein